MFLPSLKPSTRTLLLWLAALAGYALLFLALPGCRHAASTHVEVPTAAAVQRQIGAPAEAARASNARVMQLAVQAEKTGLAAGSADARTIRLASTETDRHIAEILAGKDQLTAQLGETRIETAALEKDRDAKAAQVVVEKARGDKEEAAHKTWRLRWFLTLLAGEVLVSLLGAQLQAWSRAAETAALHGIEVGARTVGAWVLKVPAVAKWVLKLGALAVAFL